MKPECSSLHKGMTHGLGGGGVGATSRVQRDAHGMLSYPLLAIACQLILQVLGLQLKLSPLLYLLLAFCRKLLSFFLHGRDFGLQLSNNTLCLLQRKRILSVTTICLWNVLITGKVFFFFKFFKTHLKTSWSSLVF